MKSATKVCLTTILGPFTYNLGRSLYIPLTSRCNSLTLPQTRGPNFSLPNDVVGSLMNVRAAEEIIINKKKKMDTTTTKKPIIDSTNIRYSNNRLSSNKNTNTKVLLPPPILPTIVSLPDNEKDDRELMESYLQSLMKEIQSKIQKDHNKDSSSSLSSFVIAGEGEPTLRTCMILSIAQFLQRQHHSSSSSSPMDIRVVTNGLGNTIPENRNTNIIVEMKNAGVTSLSVALMTSCPVQYEELMKPKIAQVVETSSTMHDRTTAHGYVCEFIKNGIDSGLDVEVTGVDNPIVNKIHAEELAMKLGVTRPFRWRPFFP